MLQVWEIIHKRARGKAAVGRLQVVVAKTIPGAHCQLLQRLELVDGIQVLCSALVSKCVERQFCQVAAQISEEFGEELVCLGGARCCDEGQELLPCRSACTSEAEI